MKTFDDKVIVITGAAGGIGRATVTALKNEGATVVGIDLVKADDTGADSFLVGDLTDAAQVQALYAEVAHRYGHINGLFNNAGTLLPEDGSILDTDADDFDRALRANVRSVYLCCQSGIPHLLAAGGGSIVNTGSLAATLGSAVSQLGYAASKGAVVTMSRELAIEFALRGIRVNTLSPGPIDTPMMRGFHYTPAELERRMVHIPPRRYGTPEEMAGAAVFLLSDASSYVNGIDLRADGGISAAYVTPEEQATPSPQTTPPARNGDLPDTSHFGA
ncbi:SDR family oxidoreductase [Streptomyces sp. NPDC093252]|uniref:SDR family oxidoreductase n=1 Tax=Streptomyces sp. NPDC093252 TaxID=3154980 RepID=UPI003415F900